MVILLLEKTCVDGKFDKLFLVNSYDEETIVGGICECIFFKKLKFKGCSSAFPITYICLQSFTSRCHHSNMSSKHPSNTKVGFSRESIISYLLVRAYVETKSPP